jgi:mannose-6-phosphate isomerase-like protein (cupin superfamily)
MRAMSDYTIINLADVDDSASGLGLDFGSARFPRDAVGAERTGFAHLTLLPGRHQPFGHRHQDAEEVYFVISGSGAIRLDDAVHPLQAQDIVRVAPAVTRSLQGGDEGMEVIVFGARHGGDGELVQGHWDR